MKNYLDIENIMIVEEKIKSYIKDEDEKLKKLNNIITNFSGNYSSKNDFSLDEVHNICKNSMNLLNRIHNTDILVIDKNIEKYRTIAEMVSTVFEDER